LPEELVPPLCQPLKEQHHQEATEERQSGLRLKIGQLNERERPSEEDHDHDGHVGGEHLSHTVVWLASVTSTNTRGIALPLGVVITPTSMGIILRSRVKPTSPLESIGTSLNQGLEDLFMGAHVGQIYTLGTVSNRQDDSPSSSFLGFSFDKTQAKLDSEVSHYAERPPSCGPDRFTFAHILRIHVR
jgi:hypothetical protein